MRRKNMANAVQPTIVMKWKELKDSSGVSPKPRHGHRCVAYGKYIIVVGGGNEGIIREISVFNTVSGKWFCPSTNNLPPPGCAAFGIVCYNANMYIFGGIREQGTYSNETYKICLSTWNWDLCQTSCDDGIDTPIARLGHSFTLSSHNDVYMFGGLTNENLEAASGPPKYWNDLYKLTILGDGVVHWSKPATVGPAPCPRESHSAVIHSYNGRETLIIYGGMCGRRLGDIHFLDIETMGWSQPIVIGLTPPPRSLHVSGIIGNRMIVFGGWVPNGDIHKPDEHNTIICENDWKCTNNVSCLNLENLTWETISVGEADDGVPKPRAGHCGVVLNNRLYIWSGREGFRKSWSDQVCCKDFWFLETGRAQPPSKIYMDGTDTVSAGVRWDPIPNADFFIIQIMKVGPNTVCNSQDVQNIMQRNMNVAKREQAVIHPQIATNTQTLPPLKPVNVAVTREEATKDDTNMFDFKNKAGDNQNLDISNIPNTLKIVDVDPINTRISSDSDDALEHASISGVPNTCVNFAPLHSTTLDLNYNSELINESERAMVSDVDMSGVVVQEVNGKRMASNDAARTLPPLGVTPFSVSNMRNQFLNPSVVSHSIRPTVFGDVPLYRWYESIIVSESKALISQLFVEVGYEKPITSRNSANRRGINLEPNFTYRVRIASVNTCGIGPFCTPLTFSTCVIGLPGPPADAKVVKRGDDVYLVWSPIHPSEPHEYSVYISRRISTDTILPPNLSHIKYVYEKIYQDKESRCLISPHLENCYEMVESSEPCVLLRIVAKNCRGYGPVTQIKWYRNQFLPSTRVKKNCFDKNEIPLKRFKAQ